jgi:hypothetical protein
MHYDLNVPYIKDEIRKHSQRYAGRMEKRPNIFMKNLMRSVKTPHRLKKRFP